MLDTIQPTNLVSPPASLTKSFTPIAEIDWPRQLYCFDTGRQKINPKSVDLKRFAENIGRKPSEVLNSPILRRFFRAHHLNLQYYFGQIKKTQTEHRRWVGANIAVAVMAPAIPALLIHYTDIGTTRGSTGLAVLAGLLTGLVAGINTLRKVRTVFGSYVGFRDAKRQIASALYAFEASTRPNGLAWPLTEADTIRIEAAIKNAEAIVEDETEKYFRLRYGTAPAFDAFDTIASVAPGVAAWLKPLTDVATSAEQKRKQAALEAVQSPAIEKQIAMLRQRLAQHRAAAPASALKPASEKTSLPTTDQLELAAFETKAKALVDEIASLEKLSQNIVRGQLGLPPIA